MTDELIEYMTTVVQCLVDQNELTPAEAARQTLRFLDEARETYWEAGALLGDTEEGFVAWLQSRYQ